MSASKGIKSPPKTPLLLPHVPEALLPSPGQQSKVGADGRVESRTPNVGLGLEAPRVPPARHELPKLALSAASADSIPEPQGVLQGAWGRVVDFVRGSAATRELGRARKLTEQVEALAVTYARMSDAELRGETQRFKEAIQKATAPELEALAKAEAKLSSGPAELRDEALAAVRTARAALTRAEQKVLDRLLPEAFAAVREASHRATGKRHYGVQVMAAALMHHGLIAEMYTGEGKTLAATLTAYLSALPGHGTHVVTVNDYLSRRDAEEMAPVYGFLGLSVAVLQANGVQHVFDPPPEGQLVSEPVLETRRGAYLADITYGTASEFGFDYLRDNGLRVFEDRVQRPLHSVILDEIDSLLLDEARTPLIIAGPGPAPDLAALTKVRDAVQSLELVKDAEWSIEEHSASFTESGIKKMEAALGIQNLYGEDGSAWLVYAVNALKAEVLFRRDEHYTIINGEVRTVGLSGHAYEGRRFVEGLHQAIEVKENLDVKPENRTQASITMRDFLSLYQRKAGMTGTALSARQVFQDVYGFDMARVPTRKPLIRVDLPDRVFESLEAKVVAFTQDLIDTHKTGRPILVGVEYTSTAEALAEHLRAQGLEVQVLGAKSDHEEAEIIANAGRLGAITVATTRGGRGVDIKLGGSAELVAKRLMAEGVSATTARAQAASETGNQRAKVLELGGLAIMGFEHFDSRRRDDQLRGRAGRQGDPGTTVFYSSLQDPLYDGLEAVDKVRDGKTSFDPKKALSLTEEALDRSEALVNGALTQSLPYDRVSAGMRQRYYELRDSVIAASDTRKIIRDAIEDAYDSILKKTADTGDLPIGEERAQALFEGLAEILPMPKGAPPQKWAESTPAELREEVAFLVEKLLDLRDQEVGQVELARLLEKDTLISVMDEAWSRFLDESTARRMGVGLRAYGQKDPKLEFVRDMAELYDAMIYEIRLEVAHRLLSFQVKPSPEPAE